MPLRKPQQYFDEKARLSEEARREEAERISAERANKRIKPPSDIVESNIPQASFIVESVTETKRENVIGALTKKIDTLAVEEKDNSELWERLSGIERSITSLQFDRLETSSVVRLYEIVESLQDALGTLDIRHYEDDIDGLRSLTEQSDRLLQNKLDDSIRDVNDKIIDSSVSLSELKERVESIVLPKTDENKTEIDAIRTIQTELIEAIQDIPNQESRFDPSGIINSLSDLRESLSNDISSTKESLNEKVDSLPEIRHYEDDLDNLQSFISEVRDSIKYYDTDVDDLKKGLLELGQHLGKTISEKVDRITKQNRKLAKDLKETIVQGDTDVKESFPEVKYYDDEIDGIESRINNILNTIKELPEVRYYDEDVKSLTNAVEKLNTKIDAIKIPDWSDVIGNIQEEVTQIQDLQKDFDQRWEKAAEEKDPLLDPKEFVTFEEMQKHYRTFLERVQIQLGTVGGGGAVEIMEMDDIEDDFRANPQDYDNYFLQHKYDPVRKVSSFTAALNFFAELDDIDLSDALDGNILVWDSSINGLRLVTPQSQGINNDFNPDIEIQDYGQYS